MGDHLESSLDNSTATHTSEASVANKEVVTLKSINKIRNE